MAIQKRRKFNLKLYLLVSFCCIWCFLWITLTLQIHNRRSYMFLIQNTNVSDKRAAHTFTMIHQWRATDKRPDEEHNEVKVIDQHLTDETFYSADQFEEIDSEQDLVMNLDGYMQSKKDDKNDFDKNGFSDLKKKGTQKNVLCVELMQGNKSAFKSARQFMKLNQREAVSLKTYTWILDCELFKRRRGYINHVSSSTEREFPLAFAIVAYRDVEQVERLLRAIYRPHNYYCLHVDVKAKQSDYDAFNSIVSCFDNIFMIENPVNVTWGEFSVLEAEVRCMELLWKFKTWKYYINLTGQEFPLKTNLEIVEILKVMKGANIVDGISLRANDKDFFRWTMAGNRPPHKIKLVKGSVHVAVNREFVNFCLHDNRSNDFQKWLLKTQIPDETYFATLNHNPHLGIAGSFLGSTKESSSKPLFMRYKKWQNNDDGVICKGKYIRGICVIGIGDLPQVATHPGLFVNKLYIDFEYLTLDCLEEILLMRTLDQYIHPTKIDVSFYENIDQVKYRLKPNIR